MNIIAAADLNNGIGYKNQLLYNIPEDKEFFKKMTTGKIIITGRKTFESLPVRPLPNRKTIILSRNTDYGYENTITCHSTAELLSEIKEIPSDNIFVIGGAMIYSALLKYCDTAYITKIFSSSAADSFICDFNNMPDWKISEKSQIYFHNEIPYSFITYKRYKNTHQHISF